MIPRYTRLEMGRIWADETRLKLWCAVEVHACEGWAALGKIPKSALATIRRRARVDAARVHEIEEEVRHDVIAFLTALGERVGPDARYIHLGMTSSDLLDTAFARQLADAGMLIDSQLKGLMRALKRRALQHKYTAVIGRSHGIHAEPTTFGLKLAVFFEEFERHRERLARAIDDIAVGKISGAVGTFAHIPPAVERHVCRRLHLKPAPISTQIVQRDRHAHYFGVLAGIASSLEKLSIEIRHLQRTEVAEAAEPFAKGQKGSSAMPHKRNPILCENISGLARVVRANALAALENVATWHERDISHSSVERVIAPDSTILTDFMLSRMTGVIEGLEIFPKRMVRNLELTHGLYNSQEVLLGLVDKGMPRDEAYRIVQKHAMHSWETGEDFRTLLAADARVTRRLSADDIAACFDIAVHYAHVDELFRRVFKPRRGPSRV